MKGDMIEEALAVHFAALDEDCPRARELIESIAAGDAAERSEDGHWQTCEVCQSLLDAERALNADELSQGLMESAAESWPEANGPGRRQRWLVLAGGLAAAAGMLIWLVSRRPPDVGEGVRAKGAWSLHVGIKRGDRVLRRKAGSVFHTGDELGFFYTAPQPGYLSIVFVDSSGAEAILFPRTGSKAASVPAGSEVRLDAGGQLTATMDCEWVVGAYSEAPFDSRLPIDAIQSATGTLGRDCALDVDETLDVALDIVPLIRRRGESPNK